MKCQQCQKEIIGGAKIQYFNFNEPTTIRIFCSEICKEECIKKNEK